MPVALDSFCDALVKSRLLTPEELQQVARLRRLVEREGGDPERLPAWLVAHHYLTPFQVHRLLEGRADHFFVGPYKLLERIGQGTMARVYKAVCPNGQLFALKVLPPSRAHDPRWRPLFEQEARDALRFRHPNVVRTHEASKADGLCFLALEYLEGETLAAVLQRRRRLPSAEAVRLISQALDGLQYLHDQGTAHFNLEPAHLMLVQPRGVDSTLDASIKLLAAGLGRPLFNVQLQDTAAQLSQDGEGSLTGQVDYLAPELATRPETADIRADIYALGCILYHCLAGSPPHPTGSAVDRLLRHATATPTPLVALQPEISEGLQLVVGRMMHRDPEQRYATPAEAARALRVFLPPERSLTPAPLARSVAAPLAIALAEPVGPLPAPRAPGQRRFLAPVAIGLLLLAALVFKPDAPPPLEPEPRTANAVSAPPAEAPPAPAPPQEVPPTDPTFRAPAPEDRVEPKPPAPAPKPPDSTPRPPKETPKPVPAPLRLPIPLEKDQARAWRLISEVFRNDLARSSPVERRATAQKMLRQGKETRDDEAARYVLLREARHLAARAADLELALQALRETASEFLVDEFAARVEVLEQTARATTAPALCKTLAETILTTAGEALARDDLPTAQALTALAETQARRALSRPLQTRAEALTRSLKEIHDEEQRLRAAGLDPAPRNPEDAPTAPDRCLELGRFLCFFRGNWARGLPLLAAGSDAALREMARTDLLPAKEAADRVQRGDNWWDLAQTRQGTARRHLLQRAAHWYRLALPELAGLTRMRLEQRLAAGSGS